MSINNVKNDLPWVAESRKYIGLRENTSKIQHNPEIIKWLSQMGEFTGEAKSWWREDETPWCGLFVGYFLGITNRYVVKEWYRARSWESSTMTRLTKPAYGCIVTFTRQGGGHVGFLVGVNKRGSLMVLGGNQSNAVSVSAFDKSRVTGYYWPSIWAGRPVASVPITERYNLPLLKSDGTLSENEA